MKITRLKAKVYMAVLAVMVGVSIVGEAPRNVDAAPIAQQNRPSSFTEICRSGDCLIAMASTNVIVLSYRWEILYKRDVFQWRWTSLGAPEPQAETKNPFMVLRNLKPCTIYTVKAQIMNPRRSFLGIPIATAATGVGWLEGQVSTACPAPPPLLVPAPRPSRGVQTVR